MEASLPGLGIEMIIASSYVDSTVPSQEILLNRTNRNFWELSNKSRYHLVWDIVTTRGNSYSRAAKQSPSPYEKMARCMKVLQSYQRITLDVVLVQPEGWKIGQYMMLQRSFLIASSLWVGFYHLFSEQVVKWMCSFQQSRAPCPVPILSAS